MCTVDPIQQTHTWTWCLCKVGTDKNGNCIGKQKGSKLYNFTKFEIIFKTPFTFSSLRLLETRKSTPSWFSIFEINTIKDITFDIGRFVLDPNGVDYNCQLPLRKSGRKQIVILSILIFSTIVNLKNA